MPLKIYVEHRRARRIGLERTRRRGAHTPACFGGARHRLCRNAYKESRHAGDFRGARQPPRRREIKRFRRAPEIEHDCAQRRAAQRLVGRAQGGESIAHAHQKKGGWIHAEGSKPRSIKLAGLTGRHALTDPDRTPSGPLGQGQHQSFRRRSIRARGGEYLVQSRAFQPAVQRMIDIRLAEGDPFVLIIGVPGSQALPEPGKGF